MIIAAAERAVRGEVRRAFPRCKIYCRADRRGGYTARIDLVTRSWCSARGSDRAAAVANCFELAREPAPGFPGWVETPIDVIDEAVILT